MPKFAATDYKVMVGTVNLSTSLQSVELSIESDDLETTAFGTEWRSRIGGLKSGSVTLSFFQDFGAAAVDTTLYPLLNTAATVVITPTSGTVSATNPTYTFAALVTQYSPFASSVGDIATLSVTWPVSGTITRATA
jgi:hypothetical protein